MANKYILNPDGTIQKYDEASNTLEDKLEISKKEDGTAAKYHASAPALELENNTVHNAVTKNIAFGSLSSDEDSNNHRKIVEPVEKIKSFGFDDETVSYPIKSYKPFNSYADADEDLPNAFADELEILGGIGEPFNPDLSGQLPAALFSYFAESIIRIAIVEVTVAVNRAVTSALGNQGGTIERYILRVGKYDFTEYDLLTRYVFNVLNYPHQSSNFLERITSYFIGFAQWLSPDALIDLNEIIKETTNADNVLDWSINFFGPDKKQMPFVSDILVPIVVATLEISFAALTNKIVQKRANLLFRKFYQEKYWVENNLYSAKKSENAIWDLGTDLNYYYFKFCIERIQIGLKYLNKYVFDNSYLRGRLKNSSFNRVSAQRSNIHMDYAIEILNTAQGPITGDIAEILTDGAHTPEKASNFPGNHNTAGRLDIPGFPGVGPHPTVTDIPYSWKYKDSDGESDLAVTKSKKPGQTTRIRALPQLFVMHPSLYKAIAANADKSFSHQSRNISLGKDLMQNFFDLKDSERRIPDYAVTEIENALEAEYMPFYFHDVRTNEILSFHAFIESITDSFNPEYNSSSGFGRIDDVRTYIKTTRNLNLSFTLAATSESDHDLMWYQINKIVAMVYPQWSDGYSIKDKGFKYPFTQVPTASPLIRLRVGDVIKSNYSRTNLSRLHGVGERIDEKNAPKINSPNQNAPTHEYELLPGNYKVAIKGADVLGLGISLPNQKIIKVEHPVPISPATSPDLSKEEDSFYEVSIPNPYYESEKAAVDAFKLPPDLPSPQQITVFAAASKIVSKKVNHISYQPTGKPNTAATASNLMKPTIDKQINNPITKSYESGMSRGLAGFITQLDVNYNEVTWETSRIGSKAPMLVKITVNFAPIHDIPPGLDHNGMLRAPTYNVGRINNEFFGDPKDHSYINSGRDLAMAKYNFINYKDKT